MIRIGERQNDGREDAALGAIMYDAVHAGLSLYSEEERRAWLPQSHVGPDWSARLARQRVFVAHAAGAPVGFMSLKEDYIDLAFVAANSQRQGLFRLLYARIEHIADGKDRLWTHASLMAQPAFLAVGFHVIRHETVARSGEMLRRAEMEKRL